VLRNVGTYLSNYMFTVEDFSSLKSEVALCSETLVPIKLHVYGKRFFFLEE
jgi:hypothetical protein